MVHQTILFLFRNDGKEILLSMKKRGFGEGKWNGTGGKLEEGETAEQAIIRETREEICVDVAPGDLTHRGTLDFIFPESTGLHIHADIFSATKWEGEPKETEEMRPEWYPIDNIPYDSMWIDDPHWLPQLIEGRNITATFHFNEDGSEMLSKNVESRD